MYRIKDIQKQLTEWQEQEEGSEKCFMLFSMEKEKGGAIVTSFYGGEDGSLVECFAMVLKRAEKHFLDIMAQGTTKAMLSRLNEAAEEQNKKK